MSTSWTYWRLRLISSWSRNPSRADSYPYISCSWPQCVWFPCLSNWIPLLIVVRTWTWNIPILLRVFENLPGHFRCLMSFEIDFRISFSGNPEGESFSFWIFLKCWPKIIRRGWRGSICNCYFWIDLLLFAKLYLFPYPKLALLLDFVDGKL